MIYYPEFTQVQLTSNNAVFYKYQREKRGASPLLEVYETAKVKSAFQLSLDHPGFTDWWKKLLVIKLEDGRTLCDLTSSYDWHSPNVLEIYILNREQVLELETLIKENKKEKFVIHPSTFGEFNPDNRAAFLEKKSIFNKPQPKGNWTTTRDGFTVAR